MKKVWILEKFTSPEETLESIRENEELLEAQTGNPACQEIVSQVIAKLRKIHEKNPDGYWFGYEGKSNYTQFCWTAKDFMRRHKNDGWKLRVVKAEVADDAKYWLGYKNAEENEGVLKYLYATL